MPYSTSCDFSNQSETNFCVEKVISKEVGSCTKIKYTGSTCDDGYRSFTKIKYTGSTCDDKTYGN